MDTNPSHPYPYAISHIELSSSSKGQFEKCSIKKMARIYPVERLHSVNNDNTIRYGNYRERLFDRVSQQKVKHVTAV